MEAAWGGPVTIDFHEVRVAADFLQMSMNKLR
jgi:hypothetical protein